MVIALLYPSPLNSNNNGAKPTVESLRFIFTTHKLRQICVTDNGPSFTSAKFKHFMSKNGIRDIKIAPYHLSTNGYAERAVQSFKTAMKKMEQTSSSKSLEARLQRFLLA